MSLLMALALLVGCSSPETPTGGDGRPRQVVAGCRGCHPLSLDPSHDFACEVCHGGEVESGVQQKAHEGLIPQPAHPERMVAVCGRCHGGLVQQAATTPHFTLAREVNRLRQAFGAKERLASLTAVPQGQGEPTTRLQLVDDLLRRRCLRCHLYAPGEAYVSTRHGTGCAACHLAFQAGNLADHRFLAKPTDEQCLSCHYGNRVGADYYGRFEQDINWEYRTPFAADKDRETAPAYGVGWHQLRPDLHQRAGMACIDCHGGQELMAGAAGLRCLSCHAASLGADAPPALTETAGRRQLLTALSGQQLEVPVMRDEAHRRYGDGVGCQVCHGQWGFADYGTHLLRQDSGELEGWRGLSRQGSAELEAALAQALATDASPNGLTMSDGLSGEPSPGLWLQAYERRRWEEINVCRDDQGVWQVCRPLLDLHLSYVNREGELVFDGVKPVAGTPVMQPYTPHTTGRAGALFRQRLGDEVR